MENTFTVYIVDDDDSVRNGFYRLMCASDLQARMYATPDQFLDEVGPESVGCVLLDITMPRMNGLQVQDGLRQKGSQLPVIAISARNDDKARQLTRKLGAKFFLHKPVDDQALLDAITWVCEANDEEMLARGAA